MILTSGKQGPHWQSVKRRRVLNAATGDVILDEWIAPHAKKSRYHQELPKEVMHVTHEFHFLPQEKPCCLNECMSVHNLRQVEAQVTNPPSKSIPCKLNDKPFLVAEVFSPPRFAPLIEGVGGTCRSYDLSTGFDFTKSSVRDAVAEELRQHPPELLVLCPPCTDEGGWFNLNSCTMDSTEYIRRVRRSRMFIRFCCKLFHQLQVVVHSSNIPKDPSCGPMKKCRSWLMAITCCHVTCVDSVCVFLEVTSWSESQPDSWSPMKIWKFSQRSVLGHAIQSTSAIR